MFEVIVKGVLIGLFVSVPMGPIGMLCVQRTLDRGRKFGIATGLGATTSDLIYTLVAIFFIGFVEPFLENNKLLIQIAGSLIVIGFGIFIYTNNPSTQPRPHEKTNNSIAGDFFSSMILTMSNPLILFVLLALFARFGFFGEENTNTIHYITGILSILGGAFLWWNLLTFFVSKFRHKLSFSGLKLLNKVIGGIISGIGLIGVTYNALQTVLGK
jgi:threonine/homoserine/homoserine lactone efflux protein